MLNRSTLKIILGAILLFHVALFIHAAYLMFSDFNGLDIQYGRLAMMLLFTITWLGIYFQKRLSALVYFSLVTFELLMKLFFGKVVFGDVFGNVFFPADILFIFIVLFLYKQIFGERINQ